LAGVDCLVNFYSFFNYFLPIILLLDSTLISLSFLSLFLFLRLLLPVVFLVFLPISAHFTATPGIPLTSSGLEPSSIHPPPGVEPRAFRTDLPGRLHALYAQ